jgi:2-haloacid dehalogenase
MAAPAVAIFDVNETLSDLSPLAARFEEVGAPPGLLASWFAGTLRDGIALAASGGFAPFLEVGRAVLIEELARLPRLSHPPSEAADHVLAGLATLAVHPDVPEGLRLLDAARIRIATLTNGSAEMARGLMERAGLDALVDRNLDVTQVQRWKPAPEPYLYACHELGVAPADATLIAVHPWDVHGAVRAGLRGAWLDRAGLPYPNVFERPSASGSDLPSLVRALIAL